MTEAEYRQAKARVLSSEPGVEPLGMLPAGGLHRLARSRTDVVLGGVCGGLAKQTNLPSWIWRLIFCFAVLAAGTGFWPTSCCGFFMPLEEAG